MPLRMRAKVVPAGNMSTNLTALRNRLAKRIEPAQRAAAEKLLELAQDHVPKDTMALHDSGHVTRQGWGLQAVFTVGFGRKDFDASGYGEDRERRPPMFYCVIVHQTQSEFLNTPLLQQQDELRAAFYSKLGRQS